MRHRATDTVAIWGCGPVGQFASGAPLLGAGRVIAIDDVPERLAMARAGGAKTIDFEGDSVVELLSCRRKGPENCIDAVGMEAPGAPIDAIIDRAKRRRCSRPTGRMCCGRS